MSTVTRPPSALWHSSGPPVVSIVTWSVSASAISRKATQRAALPQDSTSPPSALKMRMKALALLDGSITIT